MRVKSWGTFFSSIAALAGDNHDRDLPARCARCQSWGGDLPKASKSKFHLLFGFFNAHRFTKASFRHRFALKKPPNFRWEAL